MEESRDDGARIWRDGDRAEDASDDRYGAAAPVAFALSRSPRVKRPAPPALSLVTPGAAVATPSAKTDMPKTDMPKTDASTDDAPADGVSSVQVAQNQDAPLDPSHVDIVGAVWRRAGRDNAIYARRLQWDAQLRGVVQLLGVKDAEPGAEALAKAAADWQLRNGLEPDGIVGPETWGRIQSKLRASSRLSPRTPSVRRMIERRWVHDNPAPQILALSRDTVLLWNFPLDGATLAARHADALTGFVSERLRRVGSVFKAFRVVARVSGVASSSEPPDLASRRADAAARVLIRHFAVRAGDMIEVSATSAARPVTSEKTGRGFAMNRSVRARLIFLQR